MDYLLPFQWEWDSEPYDMSFFTGLARGSGCRVWPYAYNRNLAPTARLPISQFHIIQPQVV